MAVVDDLGALIERVSYDPYGRARHHWAEDVDGDGDQDTADSSGLSLVGITNAAYNVDADLDRDGDVDAADTTALAGTTAALAPGRLSGEDNHFGYSGYVYNAETELYTVRFRHYHAALGRWLERDPAGYMDSMNLYGYGTGSPLLAMDPYGLLAGAVNFQDPELRNDPWIKPVADELEKSARELREQIEVAIAFGSALGKEIAIEIGLYLATAGLGNIGLRALCALAKYGPRALRVAKAMGKGGKDTAQVVIHVGGLAVTLVYKGGKWVVKHAVEHGAVPVGVGLIESLLPEGHPGLPYEPEDFYDEALRNAGYLFGKTLDKCLNITMHVSPKREYGGPEPTLPASGIAPDEWEASIVAT